MIAGLQISEVIDQSNAILFTGPTAMDAGPFQGLGGLLPALKPVDANDAETSMFGNYGDGFPTGRCALMKRRSQEELGKGYGLTRQERRQSF